MKTTTIPTSMWKSVLIGVTAFLALTRAALAQHPIPEAERWATITHPGNEAYVATFPSGGTLSLGRVDYEYQISRTEVTGAEWFEFVQAYAPYVQEDAVYNPIFTSRQIAFTGYRQYVLPPQNANRAVEVGWTFATRYTNWLHNGKALTPEAFESGAYDTSVFEDPDWSEDLVHSPDARYWVPTGDEWLKSAHFDPNRYGPGMPGYWLYSHSSDVAPIFGSPANGGETSSGGSGIFSRPDVAAYRDVQSPWGLWDTSGGFSEWVTSLEFGHLTAYGASVRGSSWRESYGISVLLGLDRIDGHSRLGSIVGLRIARAVPGTSSAWVAVCAVPLITRRRRQTDGTHPPHRRVDLGSWHPAQRK